MFKSKKAREEEAARLEAERQAEMQRKEEARRRAEAEGERRAQAEAEEKQKAERRDVITARLNEIKPRFTEAEAKLRQAVVAEYERLEQEYIVPQCPRWEYRVEEPMYTFDPNPLGQKGWELVAVYEYQGEALLGGLALKRGYIFKRPVVSIPDEAYREATEKTLELKEQFEALKHEMETLEQELAQLN